MRLVLWLCAVVVKKYTKVILTANSKVASGLHSQQVFCITLELVLLFLLRSSCYRLHGFQSALCDEVEEIVPQRYDLWIKNQHGSHFANVKVVVMQFLLAMLQRTSKLLLCFKRKPCLTCCSELWLWQITVQWFDSYLAHNLLHICHKFTYIRLLYWRHSYWCRFVDVDGNQMDKKDFFNFMFELL